MKFRIIKLGENDFVVKYRNLLFWNYAILDMTDDVVHFTTSKEAEDKTIELFEYKKKKRIKEQIVKELKL
jgi:hypothetical protein